MIRHHDSIRSLVFIFLHVAQYALRLGLPNVLLPVIESSGRRRGRHDQIKAHGTPKGFGVKGRCSRCKDATCALCPS